MSMPVTKATPASPASSVVFARQRPKKPLEKEPGERHAHQTICDAWRDGSNAGGSPAPGTSRIYIRVRREQAREAARYGHESGVDQSAFVDTHRREGPGRQSHELGDRRRHAEYVVQARRH